MGIAKQTESIFNNTYQKIVDKMLVGVFQALLIFTQVVYMNTIDICDLQFNEFHIKIYKHLNNISVFFYLLIYDKGENK